MQGSSAVISLSGIIQLNMLLKIFLGESHFVHLRLLLQGKCPNWPEGGLLDLVDLETGTLMGVHMLEPWEMAAPSFIQLDTQKKVFTPVALTVEKGLIQAIEPMLENFAEQFPEAKAVLDSQLHTKIKGESKTKRRVPAAKSLPPPTGDKKESKIKTRATKKAKDKRGLKK